MEALGRLFDIVAVADDVYLNMKNASAVTFVGVLAAGETYTLTEATTAAGGGAQALNAISRSHVQTTGRGRGHVDPANPDRRVHGGGVFGSGRVRDPRVG